MAHEIREVLIPLVAGDRGALARVLADTLQPPPHPARLDPVISELLEHGLYQAGQQAVAALRRCRQRRLGLLGGPSGALSIVNPGDTIGLASDNAASAELGLALALALLRSRSPVHAVLATGALDPGSDDARVPVRPIHHLDAKLALIERHFRRAGVAHPPARCLVPECEPDGTPVAERHAPAIRALATLGIRVQPVATLAAALTRLQATTLAARNAERWLRRSAAGIGAAAVLALAAQQWLSRPLPVAFVPYALDDGRVVMTPFRGRWQSGGTMYLLGHCTEGPGMPVYGNGEVLALRIHLGGDRFGLDHRLGYHAALVGIGSHSGVKVLPFPDFAATTLHPDDPPGLLLPVLGPDEDNLIAVLVRRLRPFDRDALQQSLRARLDPLNTDERISAARNLLEQEAPGVITYLFRNTGRTHCL